MRLSLLSFVAGITSLAAQGSLTVPSDAIGRDGLGLSPLAGLASGRRQQFLIGESLLPGMRGRRLTGLSFRRDGQLVAFASGQGNVYLQLSQGILTHTTRASRVFESNVGTRATVVFQGLVSAPFSPRPQNRNAVGFGPAETVTINFPPYTYDGGVLCLDIWGTPAAGSTLRAWPIDVDRDGVRGLFQVFGQSCVQVPGSVSRHLAADSARLRVGSTMRFVGFARGGELAGLMLATQRLSTALNLGLIGSPECQLWLVPDLMLWTYARGSIPTEAASANLYVQLPHDAALLNAALHTQWLIVQGALLRTAEAGTVQLASSGARLDGALVLSAPYSGSSPPLVGEVYTSTIPVIQIHYQ
jgi:hypothetical protein